MQHNVPGYALGAGLDHGCPSPRVLSCKLERSRLTLPAAFKTAITGADRAVIFARQLIGDQAREHLLALFLNNANCVLSWDAYTIGSLSSAQCDPSAPARGAVMVGATGLITVHNHPSGKVKPSREDEALWQELGRRCACLDIRHLDDLILGYDEYYCRTLGATQPFPGDIP